MSKKVLLVGSGGREHALARALKRTEESVSLYVYPGNAGIEADGGISVKLEGDGSWEDLAQWASKESIDLTVVGPEVPLCEGISDIFRAKDIPVFGPSKAAAQLEGSKHFSKEIMKKYGIPTAGYRSVSSFEEAQSYLAEVGAPIVIKVSGLAAGKGAIVCPTLEDAEAALHEIYKTDTFGDAASTVVFEEMMYGEEASVFVVTDGTEYKILPVSQDHKRIFDNDEGPNTGGMGAYTPAPIVNEDLLSIVKRDIIEPTLAGMRSEGHPYKGLLYVGLMMTEAGPKVVEYNCRFGDPETEAVLPLIQSSLYDLFLATEKGGLSDIDLSVYPGFCATVIMASKGYPATSQKGVPIYGIEEADSVEDVEVYFAGVALSDNQFVTNGGRVLAVTGRGETLKSAIDKAYEGVAKISFDGMQYRKDIGKKGLSKIQ